MAENAKNKREARVRRSSRVRRKVRGSQDRPRLAVFRSARHISAQIIDDDAGRTLASVTSEKLETPSMEGVSGKVASAKFAGQELAKRAQEAGISSVVFDRAGYKFHGRVAALAEGARSGGLKF